MSTSDDRIPVPSNGHHALPAGDAADTAAASAGDLVAAGAADTDPGYAGDLAADERDAPKVIVTPGQATVVGFGILAGLILLVLGRRRGRNG